MGRFRGYNQPPVNQSGPKGKEMTVTGRWWPGDNGLCFASTTEIVLPGADALVAMSPLSSHRSLPVAGALMAFKCLTCAHVILVGLVLCWKEDPERCYGEGSGRGVHVWERM